MDAPENPRRLIALGASNLTRGFAAVVATATSVWGEPLEILGALGHGRSYGMKSRLLFRSLPGILESGLWDELSRLPPAPARALISDVGNDILYGAPVPIILAWVEETVARLRPFARDIVITDLPLRSIRELSRGRFMLFRSVLVPSCRLSLAQALERSERLAQGLVSLAETQSLKLVRLRPEWYGLDPIHIRPRYWAEAWREILLAGLKASAPAGERRRLQGLRLYLARPSRRWLFGIEQRRAQPALRASDGTSVWLY